MGWPDAGDTRTSMAKYFGVLTIVLLLGMVLTRISVLRKQGIEAMKFGHMDKTDFLIPPFALFYFYVLFAAAFHWPTVTTHQFFHSENNLVDRSVVLPGGAVAVLVEPNFLSAELSSRH